MVLSHWLSNLLPGRFQYSLCRVVLMVAEQVAEAVEELNFQYSLCRVVLMVDATIDIQGAVQILSVLALSSRFDGHIRTTKKKRECWLFQYSLCRVVLMVLAFSLSSSQRVILSVLALSSRFDGRKAKVA